MSELYGEKKANSVNESQNSEIKVTILFADFFFFPVALILSV